MSNLPTYTAGTKPASPAPGDVIYLSDTNKLAVYDGDISDWRLFNSDALVFNSAAPNEINYAGGLYDDPAANYYLDVSPIMHFDANFINGVDSSGNPAQGQPVVTWNDRSQSSLGIDLTQPEAVKQGDYDNSQGTAGVQNQATGFYELTQPFNRIASLTQVIVSSDPMSTGKLTALTTDPESCATAIINIGGVCNFTLGARATTGPALPAAPSLHVSIRDEGTLDNLYYLNGGAVAASTNGSFGNTSPTYDYVKMFSQYLRTGTGMLVHEVMIFDQALTTAQLNVIRGYVNVKHGLSVSTFT